MIIIGAGIGGLLAGALFQKNNDVIIFEKGIVGGRFRNLPYKGFQLSTGAFHALPHGATGPTAGVLTKAGVPHTIVDGDRWGTFLVNGEKHTFKDLHTFLSFMQRLKVSKILLDMRFRGGDDTPIDEYLEDACGNELVNNVARAFCGFGMSIDPHEIPTRDFFSIVKSLYSYGGPGTIMGGCSAITDELTRRNEIVKREITEIVVEDGKVQGVVDGEGVFYEDGTVISDVGAKDTVKLAGKTHFPQEYVRRVKKIREAEGIKINIAAEEPILHHNGVLLTCDTERVEGLNQVTNVDPSLAPKGQHLIMTHQTLRSSNIKKEIDKGLEDIEKIFGDTKYEVLLVQTFRNGFPVNRAINAHDLDQKTPVEGLYLVGDSAKKETMEVDGIAQGVLTLYRKFCS